jgi:hypothetical protein
MDSKRSPMRVKLGSPAGQGSESGNPSNVPVLSEKREWRVGKNKPDQVLRQRCELVVKHSSSHDRAPLSPQEPHRSSHMNSWGPERVNK